jgi:hypothetical protein
MFTLSTVESSLDIGDQPLGAVIGKIDEPIIILLGDVSL